MSSATMSEAERATLLDVAMRSRDPEAYLAGLQTSFESGGRSDDATLAASLQLLVRAGEIELLMFMRAEWMGRPAVVQPRPTRST